MDRWFLRGWRFQPSTHPPHGFGRLGAFVDGVYAIAATLLVLELRLPEQVPAGEPGRALGELRRSTRPTRSVSCRWWAGGCRAGGWTRGSVGTTTTPTLLILGASGIFSLTPFTTQVLSRAFVDAQDLGTAVRLSATLLFVASALYSAPLV